MPRNFKSRRTIDIFPGVLLCIGVILLFTLLYLDRENNFVTHTASDVNGLSSADMTWIPFEIGLLEGAAEIVLKTDVDMNTYFVRWNYKDLGKMAALLNHGISRSSDHKEIDCSQLSMECREFGRNSGKITLFRLPIKGERYGDEYWLFDLSSGDVLGTNFMPLNTND